MNDKGKVVSYTALGVVKLALEFVANDIAFKKLCKGCQERVAKARRVLHEYYKED